MHREDGPSIEKESRKEWRINGKLHRIDGPAVEFKDGTKKWYVNNQLHRKDGPAIEWVIGAKFWYYHGTHIDVNSQEEFELYLKNLIFI